MQVILEVMLAISAVFMIGVVVFLLYNLVQETVTRKVKVVGKRTSRLWTRHGVRTQYLCTFESADGRRKEYVVRKGRYALIAEGDQGELDTKGVIFWDFRRRAQQVTGQEHGVVVDQEEAATDEPADEDNLAEPTECVECHRTIPAGTAKCPACGWSYQ